MYLFRGRLNRKGFLLFALLHTFVGLFFILGSIVISNNISEIANSQLISAVLVLVVAAIYIGVLLVSLSIYIKRLHDLGKSGWWSLLFLVPVLNVLLFIYLLFFKGNSEENKYGRQFSFNGSYLGIVGIFVVLSLLIFAFALFQQRTGAMKLINEGDELLKSKDPYQALQKYQKARERWPLLKYDRYHQQQTKIAATLVLQPGVMIFFRDAATSEEIEFLAKEIKQLPGIEQIEFISKEKALEIYRGRYKDNAYLLELVTSDMLPASLNIYLNDAVLKDRVAELAKSKLYVEDVVK